MTSKENGTEETKMQTWRRQVKERSVQKPKGGQAGRVAYEPMTRRKMKIEVMKRIEKH